MFIIILADVDECAKGTHRCQANKQKCVNHEGGYKCIQVACDDGLKLVNNVCIGMETLIKGVDLGEVIHIIPKTFH